MKTTEKLDLGLDIQETTPHLPDLKWGGKMLVYLGATLLFCYICFWGFSWSVLYFIDLEDEEKYLGNIFFDEESELLDMNQLQYSLPEGKDYDVYILEDEMENAFAMIGARILVTQGLLDAVEYEEELLFIIGHEIAHLENRDALRSFLIHAPLTLSLTLLGFDTALPLDQVLKIFINSNSRAVEREADEGGVELLQMLELNTKCALGFFERNGHEHEKYFEIFSTHPVSEERMEFIQSSAGEFGDKECTKFEY